MTTRHDIRNVYPFHAVNPRLHVACCKRPTYNQRKTLWSRLVRWLQPR